MSSNKIARINDDIQRVVSAKLRDIKDPRVQQGMITPRHPVRRRLAAP